MPRLPIPGSDEGTWGDILNDFLAQEHNADGSLKIRTNGTMDAKAEDAAVVHKATDETITGDKDFTGELTIAGQAVIIEGDSRLTSLSNLEGDMIALQNSVDAAETQIALTAMFHTVVEPRIAGRLNVYVTAADPSAEMGEGDIWIGP